MVAGMENDVFGKEDDLSCVTGNSDPNLASPEETLLHAARHGNLKIVQELLQCQKEGVVTLDINCRGKLKSNLGWSPLHLACYFGHAEVAEQLILHGADINIANNVGDTPLHKAAFTSRVETVTLLLKYRADVSFVNSEGLKPGEAAIHPQIKKQITAAEGFEQRKIEESFLMAARDGDCERIETLLRSKKPPDINCTDSFGNTALHSASFRDQVEVAILLLQNGIDTSLKNDKGNTATHMARTTQMKQVLEVKPLKEMKSIVRFVQRCEGALEKKSRFFGWKPVWVVLERGVMSYYANRADASTGTKRKSFKYLDNAKVLLKREEYNVFVIQFSDDTSHTLCVDNTTDASVKLQKWVNAVTEHAAYSTYYTTRGLDVSNEELDEMVPLGSMHDALHTSQAYQQVLEKQVMDLINHITIFAHEKTNKQISALQLRQKLDQLMNSSREMCVSLTHCLTLFAQQEELRKLQLQQEMDKSRVLQDALHALATEHHELEQSIAAPSSPPRIYDTEDDEFYDCDEDSDPPSLATDKDALAEAPVTPESEIIMSVSHVARREDPYSTANGTAQSHKARSKWGGRTRLPSVMFSRSDFSIWSILKQCIGKELSKITMPVIFNEPLSFLQRITEYLEYSNLLHSASETSDPVERLQYVAAFAVSSIASNEFRIGKPFNPLLGETFELDRPDLGFKLICEQVSHHPPVSAIYVESPHFTLHGAIHPKLKFWGKSVEVTPKGTLTLYLKKHGETYTWHNVNCCVHNIIVGRLWIEHYGVMEVTNHTNKMKAVLNFKPSGWFGKDLHKVEGYVIDKDKNKLKALYGKWPEGLQSYEVDVWESFSSKKSSKSSPFQLNATVTANGGNHAHEGSSMEVPDDIPVRGSSCNLQLPTQKTLWVAEPRPKETDKYYAFTLFAMMLNELMDDARSRLCPTDSRLRPDMRKMEEGDIDGAAEAKVYLEEKQRAARKDRKKQKEEWTPRWFVAEKNPLNGKDDWMFTNRYWKRDWSECPDIF